MKGGRHRGTKLARGQGGEAGEQGVDEHDLAGGSVTDEVVDVEVAGGVGDAGDVEAVVAVLEWPSGRAFSRRQIW
jgi:hypothetical protein